MGTGSQAPTCRQRGGSSRLEERSCWGCAQHHPRAAAALRAGLRLSAPSTALRSRQRQRLGDAAVQRDRGDGPRLCASPAGEGTLQSPAAPPGRSGPRTRWQDVFHAGSQPSVLLRPSPAPIAQTSVPSRAIDQPQTIDWGRDKAEQAKRSLPLPCRHWTGQSRCGLLRPCSRQRKQSRRC